MYEDPLREITTFCTPNGRSGQQEMTFFTAIEGSKRYMYQIQIRGEQPKLNKLKISLCSSCTILHCTEETLLVGDTVNNSTFIYSITGNARQSTPMSAESAPILVHTFEAPTVPTSPTGNHNIPTTQPLWIDKTDSRVTAGVVISVTAIILLVIVLVVIVVVILKIKANKMQSVRSKLTTKNVQNLLTPSQLESQQPEFANSSELVTGRRLLKPVC